MSPQAIALAIANAIRPAGIAAVYALLSAPEPRRLLLAYLAAGFAWSTAVGIIVVAALHGVTVEVGNSTPSALIELLGGVAALGFAAGRATGRLEASAPKEPSAGRSRLGEILRNPTGTVAVGAGVVTHLPGIFYLLGLNAIAETNPRIPDGIADVLIFNAIWFTVPIASLALSIRRPAATRDALGGVNAWARRHEAEIVTALFAAAGLYFAAKGTHTLLD